MNKFYVYVHYRLDNQEPFYVGKGCGDRAYQKVKRSTYWRNIATKHGYRVEILRSNLLENVAFTLESFFIQSFGRLNQGTGSLVNLTDGGEGASGRIPTKIHRKRMSVSNKGQIPWNKGKRGVYSIDTRNKIAATLRGKKHTTARKRNLSISHLGVSNGPHTEETKQKMRDTWKRKALERLSSEQSEKM